MQRSKDDANGIRRRPLVAVILDAARPYDRLIIGGVASFAREQTSWCLYVEEDPLQKLPDLANWHGDGIIANFDDRRVAAAIRGLDLPVVGVGGGYGWYDPGSGIPYVYTDNAEIARQAAAHLLACGFDQFAYYGCPRTRTTGWSEERGEAFQAACQQAGKHCEQFVGRHRTPRRWEALQQELAEWLIGLPKPVGLMACNDARARYVLEACRLAGLKVPDDVAVIGVDNDEMICELTEPPLSSVDQAARRVGYEAARLLAGRLAGVGSPPLKTVVPPVGVVTRASTDTMATSDETVVQVLRSLRVDPRQKPDVEALAGQACISRSTLEKRFRGVVGRSIHQEHIRLKLAVVRQMIAETGLPIKTVASRCGFSSVQYMTSFLQRHLGATPARLRQEERARE